MERLRKRGLARKRSLALREFALGHEALRRFIARAGPLHVPLITSGQSVAGGLSQYQVAAIINSFPWERPQVGFITFNAAQAAPSIERFGLKPGEIPGLNFSKDCDPDVGPRSLLPNHAGLQIYIRPDGSAGLSPGPHSLISALLRPWEHFLGSFKHVALGKVLWELGIRDHEEASNDITQLNR